MQEIKAVQYSNRHSHTDWQELNPPIYLDSDHVITLGHRRLLEAGGYLMLTHRCNVPGCNVAIVRCDLSDISSDKKLDFKDLAQSQLQVRCY